MFFFFMRLILFFRFSDKSISCCRVFCVFLTMRAVVPCVPPTSLRAAWRRIGEWQSRLNKSALWAPSFDIGTGSPLVPRRQIGHVISADHQRARSSSVTSRSQTLKRNGNRKTQTAHLTGQERKAIMLVKTLRRLVLGVHNHGKHTEFRSRPRAPRHRPKNAAEPWPW